MLPRSIFARARTSVFPPAARVQIGQFARSCTENRLRKRLSVMACSAAVSAAIGVGEAVADDVSVSTAAGAQTHSVVSGDTLWDLSNRYYRSSWEWPRLWSYNPEITNPHWIYPGHVLRLQEGAAVGADVANVGNGGLL